MGGYRSPYTYRIDGFHGHGFTSGGQESESAFSAAVCKIQAGKHYIKSKYRKIKEAVQVLSR